MKIICDWNNCDKVGEYKAPIEKDNSKEQHIKIKHATKCTNFMGAFSGVSSSSSDDEMVTAKEFVLSGEAPVRVMADTALLPLPLFAVRDRLAGG